MPAVITPAERQMIDAAIAAGRVTVVPIGASWRPLPVWDGRKLVCHDLDPTLLANRPKRSAAAQPVSAFVAAVLEAHERGLHVRLIQGELNTTYGRVYQVLNQRGITPHPIPPEVRSEINRQAALVRTVDEAVARRRSEVARLHLAGATAQEICDQLALSSQDRVRGILRSLGLKAADRGRDSRAKEIAA